MDLEARLTDEQKERILKEVENERKRILITMLEEDEVVRTELKKHDEEFRDRCILGGIDKDRVEESFHSKQFYNQALPALKEELSSITILDLRSIILKSYLCTRYIKDDDGHIYPKEKIIEDMKQIINLKSEINFALMALLLTIVDETEKEPPALTSSKAINMFYHRGISFLDSRLLRVIEHEKASNLAELIECAELDIPGYLAIQKIGQGSYKKAYLVEHEELPETTYTLLITDVNQLNERAQHYLSKLGKTALENCRSEAQKLAKFNFLRSPHLPLIIAPPVYDKERGIYYWVEEYVEKKLLDVVGEGPIYYKTVADVMELLAKALIPVHELGYFHGDFNFDHLGFSEIKDRNFLRQLDNGHLKVLDWGLCSSIPSDPQDNPGKEFLGYRLSRAPEIYRGELPTDKSDVWSVGVIAYKLLTGKYPFTWSFAGTPEEWHALPMSEKSKYEEEVKEQVLSFSVNDLQTKIDQDTSLINTNIGYRLDYEPRTVLWNLISAIVDCLTPDPLQRISSADLYQKVEGLSRSDSAYILCGP